MKSALAITCFLGVALCVTGCDGSSQPAGNPDSSVPDLPVDAAPPPPPPSCAISDQNDPLCAVNQAFRSAYVQRRTQLVEQADPVIISIGDKIILRRNGQREEFNTIGDYYHELKSVAHAPLGLYVMLEGRVGAELDAAAKEQLQGFRGQLMAARDSMASRTSLSAEQIARQERLLDSTIALIGQAVETGSISAADLTSYTRSTADDLLANTREAAISQLESMHAKVTEWTGQMSAEERARLRVLVANAHMPRKGSLPNQYFTALVGDPYEGKYDDENISESARMIATENMWDENSLLNLMGTHLLDTPASIAFFDDADRLHRDLLADATEEWVSTEFGITAEGVCTPGSTPPAAAR